MNNPDLKAEIKKSAISETVKTIVRSVLLLLAVLIVAAVPELRQRIWPAIPKWSLLVLSVIFLLAILALVPYVAYLQKKFRDEKAALNSELDTAKAEIAEMKAKPIYPFKFGVKWDGELNPRCPVCEGYLSGYQYVRLQNAPDISRFLCASCGRTIMMMDEDGGTIDFEDAKNGVREAAKINLNKVSDP